jgi:hypothetical protein
MTEARVVKVYADQLEARLKDGVFRDSGGSEPFGVLGVGQVLMRRAIAVVCQRDTLTSRALTGCGPALQWLSADRQVAGHWVLGQKLLR